MVVAESVLLKIPLQVLGGYAVIHATDSALLASDRKPSNRVRGNVARDVDFFGVVNPVVPVAFSVE